MQVVFRAIYLVAGALALAAGGLLVASLFLPGRAPQGVSFLAVTLIVGAVFAAMGALLFGIDRQVGGIARALRGGDGIAAGRALGRLRGLLIGGGLGLLAALAAILAAILSRLGEGYPIFG